jgi:hypothetical protein
MTAWDCARCPKHARIADGGCPAWWETIQTNSESGEVAVWRECAWIQMPVYLIEVIKASNRPAAAVESTRNEIANGFNRLVEVMRVEAPNHLPQPRDQRRERPDATARLPGPHEKSSTDRGSE